MKFQKLGRTDDWQAGETEITSRRLRERDRLTRYAVDFANIIDLRRRRGRGGAGAASVSMYRITSIHEDHLVCRSWDGTSLGPGSVYVAKPPLLRQTPFDDQTIEDKTYHYIGIDQRVVTRGSDGYIENQVVIPAYSDTYPKDIIYGMSMSKTGVQVAGSEVTIVDINDGGRAWGLV